MAREIQKSGGEVIQTGAYIRQNTVHTCIHTTVGMIAEIILSGDGLSWRFDLAGGIELLLSQEKGRPH